MKITFFYPSQELGGAELLIARLADHLSDLGHEITVIDSPALIISKNCNNKKILHLISEQSSPVEVNNCAIISFASHIATIHKFIYSKENCKLFFWSVHPMNTMLTPPIIGPVLAEKSPSLLKFFNRILFPNEEYSLERGVSSAIENNALIAMDGENVRAIKKYHQIQKTPQIIPIPISTPNEPAINQPSNKKQPEKLNFFWYGRLCDFKTPGLIYIIELLKKYHNEVSLTIIGDGPKRVTVEKKCAEANIEYKILGALSNSLAKATIKNEADAVFAMGTAALESASLGIPTVLAPASFKKIKYGLKFNWLYNTNDFDLGNFTPPPQGKHSIDMHDIVREIRIHSQKHSKLAMDYSINHHSINTIANKLLTAIDTSTLEYNNHINDIKCSPGILKRIFDTIKLISKQIKINAKKMVTHD